MSVAPRSGAVQHLDAQQADRPVHARDAGAVVAHRSDYPGDERAVSVVVHRVRPVVDQVPADVAVLVATDVGGQVLVFVVDAGVEHGDVDPVAAGGRLPRILGFHVAHAPGRRMLRVVGRSQHLDDVVRGRSLYPRLRANLGQEFVDGLLHRLQLEDALARGLCYRLVGADHLRAGCLRNALRKPRNVRRSAGSVHHDEHVAPDELEVGRLRLRRRAAAEQEQEEQDYRQFRLFHSLHHPSLLRNYKTERRPASSACSCSLRITAQLSYTIAPRCQSEGASQRALARHISSFLNSGRHYHAAFPSLPLTTQTSLYTGGIRKRASTPPAISPPIDTIAIGER